ncbi:MAG: hypothetical protein H0V17_15600, partial [Deltaproteobacteria bacterium]|nr:hypothetical protein [Deltaproteobacteria bacterium]
MLLVAGFATRADAERRRVVVLPFEGDEKAEKFHAAVIKLVKKGHTVVSTDKWESTAENLSAAKVTDKNIKKVAKKLKVDGVIEGSVQKRRDSYMIKLKLRAGKNGTVTASVDTKADGPRIDGQASRDIKDELIDAIDNLDSVREGGGDDEEDAKPAKKPKKGDDEDEDAKPAKKPKKGEDEEDAKPAKKPKKGDDDEDAKPAKKPKKGDDDEDAKPAAKPSKFGGGQLKDGKDAKPAKGDEEDALKPKKDDEEDDDPPKRPKKETAAKTDEDGDEIVEKAEPGMKLTGAAALTPANRAIDATVGLSLNARRLAWKADADLGASTGPGQGKPPNYNGVPAPGALLDITAYPLAFGHKRKGVLTGIGVSAMYDRALLISSAKNDGTKLKTASSRVQFGGVFRYPVGSLVVGGRLGYGKQSFQIQEGSDLPNVNYTMIEPGAFVKIPVGKLVFNVDVGYQLISNTGQMTKGENYGKATVSGIDFAISGDYPLTSALFARAGLK